MSCAPPIRFARRLVAGLALVIALGCASAPRLEPIVLAGNAAQTLLVLPFNVTAVMAPELEGLSPAVWDELTRYLQDLEKQLKTVDSRVARQLWLDSIRKVRAGVKGAAAGFDDAAGEFVQELARHGEFDAVIVSSLFLREAEVKGRTASWDGVSRPVEFQIDSLESRKTALEASLRGKAPAASLHVVVLDAEGKRLQEKLRGLELLVRVHVLEPGPDQDPDRRYEYVTHPHPLSDRESLRADISEALAPFFPPLRAAAE